jgi:putative membrane protein
MFPGNFMMVGWWIMIPILVLVVMGTVMFLMFGRDGFRGPWDSSVPRSHEGRSEDSETALDILKKRYANGEIGKEEFEQIKKDL